MTILYILRYPYNIKVPGRLRFQGFKIVACPSDRQHAASQTSSTWCVPPRQSTLPPHLTHWDGPWYHEPSKLEVLMIARACWLLCDVRLYQNWKWIFFFRKGYSVTTFFPFRSWYWNISRSSNHQNGLFSNISRFPADQESWLCNISKFRW